MAWAKLICPPSRWPVHLPAHQDHDNTPWSQSLRGKKYHVCYHYAWFTGFNFVCTSQHKSNHFVSKTMCVKSIKSFMKHYFACRCGIFGQLACMKFSWYCSYSLQECILDTGINISNINISKHLESIVIISIKTTCCGLHLSKYQYEKYVWWFALLNLQCLYIWL